jgi:hypothetical protein
MSDPEAPKGMKKTAKGREVSFRVRVEAAVHPIVFASDPRLPPDLLLDQPTAGSKSAQNLAKYYQNNGASIKMLVRAYIQDGSNAIRLFGPLKTEEGRPTVADRKSRCSKRPARSRTARVNFVSMP